MQTIIALVTIIIWIAASIQGAVGNHKQKEKARMEGRDWYLDIKTGEIRKL